MNVILASFAEHQAFAMDAAWHAFETIALDPVVYVLTRPVMDESEVVVFVVPVPLLVGLVLLYEAHSSVWPSSASPPFVLPFWWVSRQSVPQMISNR